jgi:hypothetical protein
LHMFVTCMAELKRLFGQVFERAAVVSTGELQIPQRDPEAEGTAAALIPVGKTQYGIYFTEILDNAPLTDALTVYCSRKGILRAWADVKSAFEYRGSMAELQFTSVLNSMDMMGAKAEAAYIPLPSDNYVQKSQLIELLLDLGVKKKGDTITEIRSR